MRHLREPADEPPVDLVGCVLGPVGSAAGYEQGQHAAWRERDGGRDARQSGTRITGQNGRESAKTSGYAHRSFRPDAVIYLSVTTATHRPTVTHLDTWRDKKETAHQAAFPQLAGRFTRVWQVLGSTSEDACARTQPGSRHGPQDI